MLILSRKAKEAIRVDGPALITVVGIKGKSVALAIEAEGTVRIIRTELEQKEKDENGK